MIRIEIKPITVNQAWQGKRFKTDLYKKFEHILSYSLPKKIELPKGKLFLKLRLGLSSKTADWDNPVKPIQDILQKKYGFNDRDIYKAEVEKFDVEKGKEFIEFKIESYENSQTS